MELDAIAAVVLGGTSLFGGRGGVVGTFVAVMLLQVLRNLFNLLGLGSFYQMTVAGVIIVLAILLNKLIDSRSGGRRPNRQKASRAAYRDLMSERWVSSLQICDLRITPYSLRADLLKLMRSSMH